MSKHQFVIPTSYQWVSIPVQPIERITVSWSEAWKPRTAVYFKCTGYWGELDSSSGSVRLAGKGPKGEGPVSIVGHHVVPKGVTDVYIASNYVLPNFCDGPFEFFHLHNLVGGTKSTEVNRWVTMELNESFQYGQNNNLKSGKLERFIVYHPPVVPGVPPPYIFQHRFTGTRADGLPEYMEELAEFMPKENGIRLGSQVSAKLFGSIFNLGKSVAGHPLHSFLSRSKRAAVKNFARTNHKGERDTDLPTFEVVCAQHFERQKVKQADAASKKEEELRAKAVTLAVQRLEKDKKIHAEITKLLAETEPDAAKLTDLAVKLNEPQDPIQLVPDAQGIVKDAKSADAVFVEDAIEPELTFDALYDELMKETEETMKDYVHPSKPKQGESAGHYDFHPKRASSWDDGVSWPEVETQPLSNQSRQEKSQSVPRQPVQNPPAPQDTKQAQIQPSPSNKVGPTDESMKKFKAMSNVANDKMAQMKASTDQYKQAKEARQAKQAKQAFNIARQNNLMNHNLSRPLIKAGQQIANQPDDEDVADMKEDLKLRNTLGFANPRQRRYSAAAPYR